MAAKDAADAEPGAAAGAVDLNGLKKVIGARRVKPAAAVGAADGFKHRVENFLIESNSTEDESAKDFRKEFH